MRTHSTGAIFAVGICVATSAFPLAAFADPPPVPLLPAAPDARAPAVATPVEASTEASVHMDAPEGTRLELTLDSLHQEDWETACIAPCDAKLSTDDRYRVAGGGVRPSAMFTLRARPGEREQIRVHGGSTGWFVVGIVATSAGGATAAFSALTFVAIPFLALGGMAPHLSGPTIAELLGALGGGLAVGGVGLGLVLSNRTTDVEQRIVGSPSQARELSLPILSGAF